MDALFLDVAGSTPAVISDRVAIYFKAEGLFYKRRNEDEQLVGTFPAALFPVGTRMLFQQTSAPTGWTKESSATYNDSAIRVVTGSASTGGTDAFTSHFGTGKSTAGHALTIAEMPAHDHSYDGVTSSVLAGGLAQNEKVPGGATTGSTGGGSAHSHTLSNFDIKYTDCIIAVKD